jgi:hypothetical protein
LLFPSIGDGRFVADTGLVVLSNSFRAASEGETIEGWLACRGVSFMSLFAIGSLDTLVEANEFVDGNGGVS